jgi:biotin transporter BioY
LFGKRQKKTETILGKGGVWFVFQQRERRRMKRFSRLTMSLTAGLLWLALAGHTTLAQCAMCRASLANSDNPAEASAAINSGILVLLVPTLGLIATLVTVVVRYHRRDSKQ